MTANDTCKALLARHSFTLSSAALPEETTRAFAERQYTLAQILFTSTGSGAMRSVHSPRSSLGKSCYFGSLCLRPLPMTTCGTSHSAVFALPGIFTRLTPQHRQALALDTYTRHPGQRRRPRGEVWRSQSVG